MEGKKQRVDVSNRTLNFYQGLCFITIYRQPGWDHSRIQPQMEYKLQQDLISSSLKSVKFCFGKLAIAGFPLTRPAATIGLHSKKFLSANIWEV